MKVRELIFKEGVSDAQIKKIERWLKKEEIYGYISEDGIIDVNGNVSLVNQGLKKIPHQFGHVTGQFNCAGNELISLKGAPSTVGSFFSCAENQLMSLEGAPKEVGGSFFCYRNAPGLLHNIHKHVKVIYGGTLEIGVEINSHLLGILYIKGIHVVSIQTAGMLGRVSPGYDDLVKAIEIINKHLKGDPNIHLCQEELIEAGLGRFARL